MIRERRAELARAREETTDPVARRDFLRLMGAAMGLAGLEGCTRAPTEEIVPYVVTPPEVTPGRPKFYASATVLDGYATGVLVESHEGRPTKVEGNPDHPASLGASGWFEQASVLGLYDPSRARATTERGSVTSWERVRGALTQGAWTAREGRGLHLVLAPTSSPALVDMLGALRATWPGVSVHFHAAARRQNVWDGARLVFGVVVEPRLDLRQADVIVALDADFLAAGPGHLRLARQFADGRRLAGGASQMNRLYAVEALHTVTGAAADHRLAVRAYDVEGIALRLLSEVAASAGVTIPEEARASLGRASRGRVPSPESARFAGAAARDLLAHRGRSVVLAGDAQPPLVHALAHALNEALGNHGRAVAFAASPIFEAGGPSHDPAPLADALARGDVDTLVVVGTNAAYSSPVDRSLAALVGRARQSGYLGLYADETSEACTFTIPEAHPLETWGDARAFDGTVSIVQPLIEPLYDGRTALDVLALYTGHPPASAYEAVKTATARRSGLAPSATEDHFRRALRRGLVAGSSFPDGASSFSWTALAEALRGVEAAPPHSDLELLFPLDTRVHDGRFTNNAWLLELPTAISKLTWENAATVSPDTASAHSIEDGDEIDLRWEGRTVRAPALVVPGQAPGTVALSLGWGRAGAEELARGLGVNAFHLRTAGRPSGGAGLTIGRVGTRVELALTQTHHRLEGRGEEILQQFTLEEYRKDPSRRASTNRRPLPLYDVRPGPAPHQWGMAIDLSVCTGCSACVVACQAENNVPTVGRDGVILGRAMHWLRIDTYFEGDLRAPETASQPMLCQHCEKAPCEYVCPVGATVHSADGLNEMVYNRCVGTRFCSNNCPYKVRRFNWFDFHHDESKTEQLVHNPDVTVRERGVMEKCTFCVQRIREDGIRRVVDRPGRARAALQTACQEACPTGAIVFGDLADAESEVSRQQRSDRAFAALDDLGTVPRVRYLARVRNPNPELL